MLYYPRLKQRLARLSPVVALAAGYHGSFPAGMCDERRVDSVVFLMAGASDKKYGRCIVIAIDLMINDEIRDREVRLIDENGEQLGVMPTHKALELAEERGLDLAKIQPMAKPPVCKLLDYDKYRYEQSRRERENRKNQRVVAIKEVQLSATIEENDVLTKAKMATKFLADGDKVKVSIRFRGRQITHSEIGTKVMQDFAQRCQEVGTVERRPLLDGRNMIMILAPKAAKASFAEKKAARAAKENPAADNSDAAQE